MRKIFILLVIIGNVPCARENAEITLPLNIDENKLIFYDFCDKIIVIPKDFDKTLEYIDGTYIFGYKVEEGNRIYESYDDSLYEKGLEKMIAVCEPNNKNTTLLLPVELKEFGEICLDNIVKELSENKKYIIEIEKDNPNFIVKDDLIYNQDGTKLLMPAKYMETIKIDENIKEISEQVLRYYERKIEISEENPYLMIDENGNVKMKFENNMVE